MKTTIHYSSHRIQEQAGQSTALKRSHTSDSFGCKIDQIAAVSLHIFMSFVELIKTLESVEFPHSFHISHRTDKTAAVSVASPI